MADCVRYRPPASLHLMRSRCIRALFLTKRIQSRQATMLPFHGQWTAIHLSQTLEAHGWSLDPVSVNSSPWRAKRPPQYTRRACYGIRLRRGRVGFFGVTLTTNNPPTDSSVWLSEPDRLPALLTIILQRSDICQMGCDDAGRRLIFCGMHLLEIGDHFFSVLHFRHLVV